jgi:hypothetical protein
LSDRSGDHPGLNKGKDLPPLPAHAKADVSICSMTTFDFTVTIQINKGRDRETSESVNTFLSLSVFIWHLIVVLYRSHGGPTPGHDSKSDLDPVKKGLHPRPAKVSYMFNDHF